MWRMLVQARFAPLAVLAVIVVVGLLTAIAVVNPHVAYADVNNFTITSFTAKDILTNADKQGELRVNEDIKVAFTDNNHGILRAIPKSYKGHSLRIHNISVGSSSGAPAQYTTSTSNGNLVLKIGDPTRTVTGPQDYMISYTVDNVISFYKDHDELYWDINGDQWAQPTSYVNVDLTLPSGLQESRPSVCYAGSNGSTAQNCIITNTETHHINAATTQALGADQTLTMVDGFKTGYFQPATWRDSLGDIIGTVLKVIALPIFVGVLSLIFWLKHGRDARGRGTIIPMYSAPGGLRPIEIGTIIDFKVDNRDITATLIDLAIRKYITIIETKKDKLISMDSLSYSIELVNADFSNLNTYEDTLMLALFPDVAAGQVIDISSKSTSLYLAASTIRSSVEKDLTTAGYFASNPMKSGASLTVIAFILIFIVFVGAGLLGFAFAVGVVISILILFFTASKMASRTVKGVGIKEDSLGLKLYLETAEAERLKMLQGPNAAYAPNAGEPVKTVDLFEKLLPYAMVLGVEKEWAKQFDGIYNQAPSWYSGNYNTFSAFYLASSLSGGMQTAVNTAFTVPSSSGSSGFSGGGFSGGGGGGGGGGGW